MQGKANRSRRAQMSPTAQCVKTHLAAPPTTIVPVSALAASPAAATTACSRWELPQLFFAMRKVAAVAKTAVPRLPPGPGEGSARWSGGGGKKELEQLSSVSLLCPKCSFQLFVHHSGHESRYEGLSDAKVPRTPGLDTRARTPDSYRMQMRVYLLASVPLNPTRRWPPAADSPAWAGGWAPPRPPPPPPDPRPGIPPVEHCAGTAFSRAACDRTGVWGTADFGRSEA